MHRALVLIACGCFGGSPRSSQPPPTRAPDPAVDATCLDHLRAGTLGDVPSEAAGFTVTVQGTDVELHQSGKPVGDEDGKRLWEGIEADVFGAGGLSTGSSGMYSIYHCTDASPPGCFHFDAWSCQVSVLELATRVRSVLDRLQLADAEIAVNVKSNEAVAATLIKPRDPAQHYATHARYDPSGARHSRDDGSGACRADSECVGEGSNHCTAWYLVGGGETAIALVHDEPWFCGCVAQRCTWFTQ